MSMEDQVDPVYTLWKVDDKAWMKQRRSEWKIIEETMLEDATKKDVAQKKKFFLTGFKPDFGYIGSGWFRYLATPFANANEARLAFFSPIFRHPHCKEQVLSLYVFSGTEWGKDMPWIRQSMRAFSEGVLEGQYRNPHCVDFSNQEIRAPDARFHSFYFCRYSMELFNRELMYHGVMECCEYYCSMLCSGFGVKKKSEEPDVLGVISAAEAYLASSALDDDIAAFAGKILVNREKLMAVYEGWKR